MKAPVLNAVAQDEAAIPQAKALAARVSSCESVRSSSNSSDFDMNAFFESEWSAPPQADLLGADALHASLLSLASAPYSSAPRMAPVPSSLEISLFRRSLRLGFGEHLVLRRYTDAPCKTLLVSFCSLTGDQEPTKDPSRQHFEFVGTAKRASVTHALFLTDPLKAWFLRLGGECKEPFDSVMAIITREVQQLRPSRLLCIGASMGGYAAARCGIALGTALRSLCSSPVQSVGVLAFGPQVFIEPSERAWLNLQLMSFEPALDRLRKVASFPLHSLVHLAAAHHASTTSTNAAGPQVCLELHVGAQAPGDVREARLLEAAVALEGKCTDTLSVEVHVHETSAHCVAEAMRNSGYLDELVRARLRLSLDDSSRFSGTTTACVRSLLEVRGQTERSSS